MQMTTLCYIEKDGKYLMLHRTKKEKDSNKNKWTAYQFRGLVTFVSDVEASEMMCLFMADGFEGDAVFLKLLLENERRFFTARLVYEGEKLAEKTLRFYGRE